MTSSCDWLCHLTSWLFLLLVLVGELIIIAVLKLLLLCNGLSGYNLGQSL